MKAVQHKKMYTFGILFMMFVASVCSTTQGVMLTDFIEYYKLKSSGQGLISVFQSAGNILALLLIGIIIIMGRLKKSTLLMVTAVTVPLVFLLMGSKPPFYILLCGYAIYGIAFGFLDSVASSVMVDLYRDRSSKYMNLLHGIYGLGGLAGPLLIQKLSGFEFTWNEILMICAAIAVGASIVYAIGAVPVIRCKDREIEVASPIHLSDVKNFFREKRKRILLICAFLYGAHQIGITVWMTRYISEYLGTPKWGPGALSAFWVGVASSRLIITRFSINRTKVIFLGHLLDGIIIAVGVLVGNGFFMLVCCGIAGFVEGTILPLTLDMACCWELKNTSLGSSMVLFALYIGFIIAPPLIGFLIDIYGVKVGMILPAIFSLTAAFFAFFLIKLDNDGKKVNQV